MTKPAASALALRPPRDSSYKHTDGETVLRWTSAELIELWTLPAYREVTEKQYNNKKWSTPFSKLKDSFHDMFKEPNRTFHWRKTKIDNNGPDPLLDEIIITLHVPSSSPNGKKVFELTTTIPNTIEEIYIDGYTIILPEYEDDTNNEMDYERPGKKQSSKKTKSKGKKKSKSKKSNKSRGKKNKSKKSKSKKNK